MLEWVDGRNSSTFSAITLAGNALSFAITPGAGANGLQALLPTTSSGGVLASITRDGSSVAFTTQGIKGIDYAFFSATAGSYIATYAPDTTQPTVTATAPADGTTGVSSGANMTVTFSEGMDPTTISSLTVELRDAANAVVPATVSYDAASRTATLDPNATLANAATYTAVVKGGASDPRVKDLAGNALASNVSWSFTTAAGPACPCSIWSGSTTPAVAADPDTSAIELGVKFRAAANGFITGIRFYKGSGNTGTHTGTLWSSTGQQLARATFTNETATGWQQVAFATPVAITANTTYVASYFAPVGRYSVSEQYFATAGTTNGPLYALRDGESGPNGVYRYSASSAFPNQTWQATNYWVDVVLTP